MRRPFGGDVYRADARSDDEEPTLPSVRFDDGPLPSPPLVPWWRAALDLLFLD